MCFPHNNQSYDGDAGPFRVFGFVFERTASELSRTGRLCVFQHTIRVAMLVIDRLFRSCLPFPYVADTYSRRVQPSYMPDTAWVRQREKRLLRKAESKLVVTSTFIVYDLHVYLVPGYQVWCSL